MIYSNTAEVIAQAAVQSQSDDTIAMVTKSLCSAEPGLDGLREPPVMAFAENWPCTAAWYCCPRLPSTYWRAFQPCGLRSKVRLNLTIRCVSAPSRSSVNQKRRTPRERSKMTAA